MTLAVSLDRPIRRVLVIDPVAELGGAERVLLDLIGSAKAIQPEIAFHVVLFMGGPLASSVVRLGATASVVPLPKRLQMIGDSALVTDPSWRRRGRTLWALVRGAPELIGFIFALRAEIERWSPDLVHTNGMKAHLLSWFVTPRHVPVVWHMHDFISTRPFARRFLRHSARRVSAVVAVSEAVARDVRSSFPSVRVVTIANAVDISEFAPGDGDGPWLDQLSGLESAPAEAHRIGLIATYARWKGQDVFLHAAARLKLLFPREAIRFYLVGGPIYATDAGQFTLDELKVLIGDLGLAGNVGLIAFQRDLVPILRSLDIVVHASIRPEPFGKSILEAMACGRAIVIAAGGGADELVESGQTALTHAAGDSTDLADTLATLIHDRDLRKELGRRARKNAVLSHSRERLGPLLLALYGSIEGRQKRGV